MAKSRLQHIRDERLEKVKKLRELGINPYPAVAAKDLTNKEISEKYTQLEGKTVTLAGRIVSYRDHGHLVFINIQDASGQVQLYLRDDSVLPLDKQTQRIGFSELKLLDIGDFVQACGETTKTKSGEISLLVRELKILTKTLRPLPTPNDIMTDPEQIFRRRYVDLTINPERRALFARKAKFWQVNREFLQKQGFIEVETPVLEHVTGGADARPFTTHMNALDQTFYLRISTELYQKRLIGGGFEKVFTIGPNFRNEGLSDEHLTEFYQVEWYWAYANYEHNMRLVESLFKEIAKQVYGKTTFSTRGHAFDLDQPWERISYPDIIREKLGIDIFNDSEEKMLAVVKEKGVKLDGAVNKGRLIDNLWKLIRKTISGPAFLINEPAFMSPLAKSRFDRPELTERFHVLIAGSELGNGYSELNDPLDQLARFQDQQAARDSGDDEAQMLDVDYVEMLEFGMPPTSGYGHSERIFWFLEDITAREGTLFPALKHKLDPLTREIYGLNLPIQQNQNPYISLSQKFCETYPTASIGYALIEGVEIKQSDQKLEIQREEFLKTLEGLTPEMLNVHPELTSYRAMYKQMGIDWHSRRPSPEALLRRVVQGKGLYSINTLVDAYNLIVMNKRISVGAFDWDCIKAPVEVKIAQGNESIILLGDEQPTVLKAGEVSYFDQHGPYNLDYNYRDAKRTMVTLDTHNVWINVDGVGDISPDRVQEALDDTIAIIQKYCGGKLITKGLLTAT